jgi:hypothetical protein
MGRVTGLVVFSPWVTAYLGSFFLIAENAQVKLIHYVIETKKIGRATFWAICRQFKR